MQNTTFKITFIALFIGLTSHFSFGQIDALRKKIQQIAASTDGTLGIGILGLENHDTLTFNNQVHYAMQSVYKFHLGLAILNQVDKGKLTLNQKILVLKKDLLPDTWSPLRDKYPNGNVEVPLSELLVFTVAQSDNNGCDILFRILGGPRAVDNYVKSIGMTDVAIMTTEEQMHKDSKAQFSNWTTPWSAVLLLEKFYQKKLLSPTSHAFMWNTMAEATTGSQKIKGLLPAGTIVAHKSGLSGANSEGITAATNDIGIVTLPNGKHFIISVFYGNTKKSDKESDRVIAEVSKAAWDYFTSK